MSDDNHLHLCSVARCVRDRQERELPPERLVFKEEIITVNEGLRLYRCPECGTVFGFTHVGLWVS